ncbi:MAG: aquaporin [Gemmataceae bacterium]|nr:aquaporin [Gemmataceae bacterium]
MDKKLLRDYFIELVGSLFFVLTAAAVTCVNAMTLPAGQTAGTAALTLHQPGLLGVALAQGLVWAVVLSLTVPVTGGFLNPAITLMLWFFNRISTVRAAWLAGAQLLGGVLAGLCLRYTFADNILQTAHFGAPHVNPLAYPFLSRGSLWAGAAVEFALTFLLVFAIFGSKHDDGAGPHSAWPAGAWLSGAWLSGAALTACVLVAFPLTGAALNPARWFGPVAWEALTSTSTGRHHPFADAFVYLAGPILGAVAGGWWCFKVYLPGQSTK